MIDTAYMRQATLPIEVPEFKDQHKSTETNQTQVVNFSDMGTATPIELMKHMGRKDRRDFTMKRVSVNLVSRDLHRIQEMADEWQTTPSEIFRLAVSQFLYPDEFSI